MPFPHRTYELVLSKHHFKTEDDLLESIGLGNQITLLIVKQLIEGVDPPLIEEQKEFP